MSYQWIDIRKYLPLLLLLPLAFIAWLGERVRRWMKLTYEDWMVGKAYSEIASILSEKCGCKLRQE